MMKEGTLICDFSGAYGAQGFLPWMLREAGNAVQVLDFKGLEGTNCYCDHAAALMIGSMLPEKLPWLRWIDSGDYHYMTHLLALREEEPFHLLLLDNHPDNQEPAFGGVLSCGSWVKAMREGNPCLMDILWIGPENGEYREWMEKRRGERLYVSLDKDVMSPDWARTDWSQGLYSLADVDEILRFAMAEMEIAAIDVCGEISASKGGSPEDNKINFETNTKLYNLLCQN